MRITKALKQQMLQRLEERYRGMETALNYNTPFELLIAVVLSAQCTDERVNVITARMFPRYNTPQAILELGTAGLEEQIRDCGLFRSKAKNISEACRILCERFDGQVPGNMEDLLLLPGVGRKTANVVLSHLFNVPAIAVDTHVFRVANRLKLAVGATPLEVEEKLMQAIPRENWSAAHHWMIWHGRKICQARKPKCAECTLKDLCPSQKID